MRRSAAGVSLLPWLSTVCLAGIASADDIKFDMPIRCELGVTCFVQNYVDHDASTAVRDYQCGRRTYDGHDGTDIRIPFLKTQGSGVEVLAAAPGTVRGMRDGVDDVSVRTIGKAAVAGKECGNGAIVVHADGWQSQYCHLAKGSLRVKPGDKVVAGDTIGLVGMSGASEFPHVHFTVRRFGKVVDPFAYEAPTEACAGGRSLWNDAIRAQTEYRAREILNYGFADGLPTMDMIDSGQMPSHAARAESEALVAYVRVIGLQQGDLQVMTIRNPDGGVMTEHKPAALDKDKAQFLISAGKKRRSAAWAPGVYQATYAVTRDGNEVLRKSFEMTVGPSGSGPSTN